MYWLEVSVKVEGETADIVCDILRPFAQDDSVVIEQLGDAANLDPNALEPDVTVKIYIPGRDDTNVLRRQIKDALNQANLPKPVPAPKFKKLEETDWANAWKEHFKPFRVGERLWIQPSWMEAQDHGPEDVILTLDPGMAFGTGTHQTTQMCLEALERLVKLEDRVLDVGTGSGILSIAAAKLGASEVVALDTERQAVDAVLENGQINRVASKISVFQGTLSGVSPKKHYWDLVLVNILAPVIISLFEEDDLLAYPTDNGRLVLSGLIGEQVEGVERVIHTAGGQISDEISMGDWVALIVERSRSC